MRNLEKWNALFADQLGRIKTVKNVRQQGTILAFDIDTGGDSTYFSDIKTQAYAFFLEQGVLLRPLGNTLFVNAPYCITETENMQVQKAILDFLAKLG